MQGQKYTSAWTSVNSKQVPAICKKIDWIPGTRNIDIGGGKYDTATEYLNKQGVYSAIYDPYNRPMDDNNRAYVLDFYDTALLSNVLNVICESHARHNVIQTAYDLLHDRGILYVTVYTGDNSGVGRESKKDCWQENRNLISYAPEIKQVFDNVYLKNGMLIARKEVKICNMQA